MNTREGKESAEEPLLAPLPRGRHLLRPEEVERHQRDRILNAVAVGMARQGYAALTVGSVISQARVSRTTFYAQFANKQEAVVGPTKRSCAASSRCSRRSARRRRSGG